MRILGWATFELFNGRVVGKNPIVWARARAPDEDGAALVGFDAAAADIRMTELLGTPELARVSTGVCRGVGGSYGIDAGGVGAPVSMAGPR